MSPEAQRIAIAEACRWKCPHGCVHGIHYACPDCGSFDHSQCDGNGNYDRQKPCNHSPDFLGDLNAMAEARKTLTTDTQRSRYFEALHQVVGPIGDNPQWAMIDASAAQHAEAFLKTIGEWKE